MTRPVRVEAMTSTFTDWLRNVPAPLPFPNHLNEQLTAFVGDTSVVYAEARLVCTSPASKQGTWTCVIITSATVILLKRGMVTGDTTAPNACADIVMVPLRAAARVSLMSGSAWETDTQMPPVKFVVADREYILGLSSDYVNTETVWQYGSTLDALKQVHAAWK